MKRVIAALAVFVFSSANSARADGQVDVKRLAQEGRDLFGKGDYAAAVIAFSQVYRATNEAKYLFNLALAEYAGQRTFDAWEHFEELKKRPDASAANVAEAQRIELEIAPKLEHLAVVAREGATILIDGAVVGTAPLPTPVTVDPDKTHTIVARQGTEETKKDVPAVGPKSVEVQLVFAPPTVSEPVTAPVAAPVERHVVSGARIWITVGLGAAALASVGTAIGFGVESTNEHGNAAQLRNGMSTSACASSSSATCTSLINAVSSMSTDHAISQGFYIGAGVLAAGAVAAWLLIPKERTVIDTAFLAPIVSPHFVGAALTEVF